ncbi:hypothetical protein LWM68_35580 [Niabella sp. W65]|nr:hypothetical protein [Niabella sp. W65]MCH7367616.1 hypothetical protein [Niabella sp. W65]
MAVRLLKRPGFNRVGFGKSITGFTKNYFNFYNGYDPLFSWWVPKTYYALDSTLGIYATALSKKYHLPVCKKMTEAVSSVTLSGGKN